MKIPTWQVSKENVELGVATPLEFFIFDHEPFEISDAAIWRSKLLAALDYAKTHEETNETTIEDSGQALLPIGIDD